MPSPVAELELTPRAETFPSRPQRVLVAEDEHLVATNLAMMLGDLGYTVLLATDGQEAVDMAKSAKPDIALLDIRMPHRDGLSAAKELYEQLGLPVVILSAYTESAEIAGAQQAGVFGYMVKPVQREQLRVGLDIAWHRFQLHSAEATESRKLRKRLEERRVIEQAKWAMVSGRGMTEPDAMRALQKRARDSRAQLIDVASAVIKELGAA
jgi:response regulator NasT